MQYANKQLSCQVVPGHSNEAESEKDQLEEEI